MTDDLVFIGFVFILFEEILGTGEGDLVDVLLHLRLAHAQAVIGDGNGLLIRVYGNLYLIFHAFRLVILPHQLQLFQLGDGIAAVGNQLTIENIVVGIQPFLNDREYIFTVYG